MILFSSEQILYKVYSIFIQLYPEIPTHWILYIFGHLNLKKNFSSVLSESKLKTPHIPNIQNSKCKTQRKNVRKKIFKSFSFGIFFFQILWTIFINDLRKFFWRFNQEKFKCRFKKDWEKPRNRFSMVICLTEILRLFHNEISNIS